MRIVSGLVQGSKEWLDLRAGYFTASEAPAMLGLSKYKSRADLVREKATGIVPEVDDATQRRFNAGHAAEEKMRAWAEKHVGDDLYPVVGVETVNGLPLLASFDGLTMDEVTPWENKLWNAEFAEQVSNGIVPDTHWPQLEQQLLISGAKAVLFTVGDDENEVHMMYESQQDRRERLLAGWAQFAADVLEYQRKLAAGEIEQPKEAPKAEAIKALPSVFVQATGMVTASNLSEFNEAATTFIAAIKTELVSDQDFADAEATVKFCKEAETNLEATKASVLAQMSTVDEVVRTLDHIKKQLSDKRLMLDKLVKSEKVARKEAIAAAARKKHGDHLSALEAEIKPIRIYIANMPDFAGAMSGLKKLSAMQEAVDTALRDSLFTLDAAATDYRAKLSWCKENAAGQSALFPDLQALMSKPFEDFTMTITSRIEKQKAEEAARMEAVRAQAEADARAKLEAEAKAKADAEAASQRESDAIEERRKAVQLAEQERQNTPPAVSQTEHAAPVPVLSDKAVADAKAARKLRPTRVQMIEVIALHYCVAEETAFDWLRSEFAEVAA